jgi:uncharacterized membrane protein YdbT with pleckstrin-like domain
MLRRWLLFIIMDNIPTSSSQPEEIQLWEGHSSQWTHLGFYLFCVIIAAGIGVAAVFTGGLAAIGLIVPFIAASIRWWLTKTTSYTLTSQRLRRASGILNRTYDDLELFRVKDYTMVQPLFLRMLGLGNLHLITSDATTPTVSIKAVPDIKDLMEKVRTAVQRERDRKRVRELDVDGGTLV